MIATTSGSALAALRCTARAAWELARQWGQVGIDAVAELIERRQREVGGSGRPQVFDRALDERRKERPLRGEIVVKQPAGDAGYLRDPLDVHPLVGLGGEQLGAEVQQLLAAC